MWDADRFSRRLEGLTGIRAERNVELSAVTSFRVGGPADVVVIAEDARGLASVLGLLRETNTTYFVLGAGTNVVFDDAGFRGVILKLGVAFAGISNEESAVLAGAAAEWSDLISHCAAHSLSGLERMAGIPGTVGGAVAGNAGAFGVTIADRVGEVSGLDGEGRERRVAGSDIHFDYRSAEFGTDLVLVGARMTLEVGERKRIEMEIQDILAQRREKHPLEFPCAGSVFKNPPGMRAGRLIEEAGLKGRRMGGAQVSEKHANFIVNRGGATSGDIFSLMELVQERVWKKFSVKLEPEVRVIR